MTFKLTITCDNEAFSGDPRDEIARILNGTAIRLSNGSETEGKLRDSNGNTVGSFQLK